MTQLVIIPGILSLIALGAIYLWGGFSALLLATLLAILEVTLSFDNAVVNAKVLERMSPLWQKRFLTWGILMAVVGTRFILPILIVAGAAFLSPITVALIAFGSPEEYAKLLETISPVISAFGGAFLLMVSLKYFIDEAKEVHWIRIIEQHLARWGRIESIEIAVALGIILLLSYLSHTPSVVTAGILGIIVFIAVQGVANSFRVQTAAAASIALFFYLNTLDAAFSLDGVVGAFAITKELPIIVVGLGIGAYFVRAITVYLVERKTLNSLLYLEHGAHWAILGLSASMLFEIIVSVPEFVTALLGFVFVGFAYVSSLLQKRK